MVLPGRTARAVATGARAGRTEGVTAMERQSRTVTLTPEQIEDLESVLAWASNFIADNPGRDDDGDRQKIDDLAAAFGIER